MKVAEQRKGHGLFGFGVEKQIIKQANLWHRARKTLPMPRKRTFKAPHEKRIVRAAARHHHIMRLFGEEARVLVGDGRRRVRRLQCR